MHVVNKHWITRGFTNYSPNLSLHHPPSNQQFDHLQMDFTELTPCEGKKYCFPTGKADASAVAKVLVQKIIPDGEFHKTCSDN